VRKLYRPAWAGQDAAAWDESWHWTVDRFEESLKILERHEWFLQADLERYMRAGMRVLEGGCGLGHLVAYFTDLGCDITGVDFARGTVEAIRQHRPDLKVVVGDVAALDFPDDFFDVYYSGGVVEHFEDGPWSALSEARRVLKPDGVLLVTVPQTNLLRQAEDLLLRLRSAIRSVPPRRAKRLGTHTEDYYRLVAETRREPERDFHLYTFSRSEFVSILKRAGFRVERTRGCSVAFGLRDIDWIDRRRAHPDARAGAGASDSSSQSAAGTVTGSSAARRPLRDRARSHIGELVVRERSDGWLGRSLVRLAGAAFGNLRLYVCRPVK
jgi:SAM-dependent methyltransferase